MIDNRSPTPSQNYIIKRVNIRGVSYAADVTDSVVTLEVYESIEGLMSGIVFFIDAAGFGEIVGVTGLEAIDIEFASKVGAGVEKIFNKSFRVTGMTRDKAGTGNQETVAIRFTNNLLTQNDFVKRPYVFNNMSVSNMVASVLDNLGDEAPAYNIEQTLFARDYVSHIAKPLDVINELRSHANSATNDSCNYVFYEDREAVNFVSLGSIREKDYDYIIRSGLQDGVDKFTHGEGNIIYALRIQVTEQTNMHNITSGIFGARTYTHSLINKKIDIMDVRRDGYIERIGVLNDVPHLYTTADVIDDEVEFSEQPLNNIQLAPSDGFYKHNNKHTLGSIYAVSQMEESYANAKRLTIEIPGNTNLTVGDVIYLDYGSVRPNEASAMASGKWIIADLTHNLTRQRFKTTIEVISDSSIISTVAGRTK